MSARNAWRASDAACGHLVGQGMLERVLEVGPPQGLIDPFRRNAVRARSFAGVVLRSARHGFDKRARAGGPRAYPQRPWVSC